MFSRLPRELYRCVELAGEEGWAWSQYREMRDDGLTEVDSSNRTEESALGPLYLCLITLQILVLLLGVVYPHEARISTVTCLGCRAEKYVQCLRACVG